MKFYSQEERELTTQFLEQGYVILTVECRESLDWMRDRLADLTAAQLGLDDAGDKEKFLNTVHERVEPAELNPLRLAVIQEFNEEPSLRVRNFSIARSAIQTIVGNELSMQRRINLSIQLPNDESSLLPIHSDVLNGDSPFEVVHWTPFVDVHGTKSMFILPPEPNAEALRRLSEFGEQGNEAFRRAFEDDFIWLEMRYGETLIFNQNLLHGNIVNAEMETRWTTNCRYKGVFTPYADKKLGEFFEPISLRAASKIGLNYRMPGGFDS